MCFQGDRPKVALLWIPFFTFVQVLCPVGTSSKARYPYHTYEQADLEREFFSGSGMEARLLGMLRKNSTTGVNC